MFSVHPYSVLVQTNLIQNYEEAITLYCIIPRSGWFDFSYCVKAIIRMFDLS